MVKNYFYTKYSNFNMDPTNNILKFEIVDGTGPFLELVGQIKKFIGMHIYGSYSIRQIFI